MLFAAIILVAAGWTLAYSGVKGDKYQINGTPVWSHPWLPLVAAFNPALIAAPAPAPSVPGAGAPSGASTTGPQANATLPATGRASSPTTSVMYPGSTVNLELLDKLQRLGT
jgi:hypothetical protein